MELLAQFSRLPHWKYRLQFKLTASLKAIQSWHWHYRATHLAGYNDNTKSDPIERCNSRVLLSPSVPQAHQALITCKMSCPMRYKGTTQLLTLSKFKSHLFYLYFIGWTINQWKRVGNWSTQRKPLTTRFRKCHVLKLENSSFNTRLKPAL